MGRLRCKRCGGGGGERIKNGLMRGKRRHRREGCGLNVTDTPPRGGMPLQLEVTAILLYLRERGVDEPHRRAPGRVHARRDEPDRAVRRGARARA